MGTDQKFESETYNVDTMPEEEKYLLSADFAQTGYTAVAGRKCQGISYM